jgi:hypothetical protein
VVFVVGEGKDAEGQSEGYCETKTCPMANVASSVTIGFRDANGKRQKASRVQEDGGGQVQDGGWNQRRKALKVQPWRDNTPGSHGASRHGIPSRDGVTFRAKTASDLEVPSDISTVGGPSARQRSYKRPAEQHACSFQDCDGMVLWKHCGEWHTQAEAWASPNLSSSSM